MNRFFKISAYAILGLSFIAIIGMVVMGQISQNKENIGTYVETEHLLGTCPESPNCVSSFENQQNSHYISDISIESEELEKIESFFQDSCKSIKKSTNYWYYTCKSKTFGFVDDVEVLFKGENLHFRSASRMGRKDFQVNRKRIENLKVFLKKKL